jgi:selenide,water dikinase
VGIRIDSMSVPLFEEAKDFTSKGLCPGGLYRNKEFYGGKVKFSKDTPEYLREILFDPQTSGGLLVSLSAVSAGAFVKKLKEAGIADAAIIGEVVSEPKGEILVD